MSVRLSRHSKRDSGELILQELKLIDNINVNDENWRCIVTMLIETEEYQAQFISILKGASANGYRKTICLIDRKNMLATTHITTTKSALNKVDSSASLERIRNCALAVLRSPDRHVDVLSEARLIKWMIYEARLESQARSALELESVALRDWEFQAMQESKAPAQNPRASSARKPSSLLRRRGEEWRDRVYVDDAPKDGSQLESAPAKRIHFWEDFDDELYPDLFAKPFRPPRCESDLYDCASYELYAVHETLESHAAYLRDMRVVQVYEERPESQRMGQYREILGLLPVESASVPVVLDALLVQVEENLKADQEQARPADKGDDEQQAPSRGRDLARDPEAETTAAAASAATPLSEVNSAAFARLAKKLGLLNLKYELIPRADDSRPRRQRQQQQQKQQQRADPELILHGDALRLNACRANDYDEEPRRWLEDEEEEEEEEREEGAKGEESPGGKFARRLESCKVGLLPEPRLAEAWRRADERKDERQIKSCKAHLSGIFKCCAKEGIELNRAKHLLNLLGFRKFLNSYFDKKEPLDQSIYDKQESCPEKVNKPEFYEKCLQTEIKKKKEFRLQKEIICEEQQRNIIFDELLEGETLHENKNNDNSLNISSAKTRSKSKCVLQRLDNIGEDKGQEENIKNDIPTSLFGPSSRCRCFATSDLRDSDPAARARSAEQIPGGASGSPDRRPGVSSLKGSVSIDAPAGGHGARLLRSFESCSLLFGLIDARESLGLPDSSAARRAIPALEEFEDVEPLAPPVFLQIVRDCFRRYDERGFVALRAFLPTDSILLLFGDEPGSGAGNIIERRVVCSVRTPVCLRDFCKYVVDEESAWLERRCKSRADGVLERCCGEIGEASCPALFREEDFLLPGSLKAQAQQLLAEASEQVCGEKEVSPKKSRSDKNTPAKIGKAGKKNKIPIASFSSITRRKNRCSRGSLVQPALQVTSSVPPAPSTLEFIGYDLGERRRVQVSRLRRDYKAYDGTCLSLVQECWLLGGSGKSTTTRSLKLASPEEDGASAWSLWCHDAKEDNSQSLFYLEMENGIIVTFERLAERLETVNPNNLLYEIEISLPSGLLIKPVEFRKADYPFYIHQYYTSKGICCKKINDESHRKYLHNGDIVKFFNDGTIIVYRTNGIIITILNDEEGDETSFSRSERSRSYSLENDSLLKEASFALYESPSEASSSGRPTLRYTVLEADGRRYEVADGQLVRELDRSRASIAEEYDPEEKFARRADGTDMLFTKDAELIMSFPDGTRTLTSCWIEPEPAHCDWSEEELRLYFMGCEPEGFVSILAHSRAEHPNYATVAREFGACSLSVGAGGLDLELDPRGLGELILKNRDRVELSAGSVSIARRNCSGCREASSYTTFHLANNLQPDPEVLPLLTLSEGAKLLTVNRVDASFGISTKSDCHCLPSVCQCNNMKDTKISAAGKFRLFAVNRSGEAYEYHHRSVYHLLKERMTEDYESSLIQYPIDERRGMEYRLALRSLKRILGGAGHWLLDYTIRKSVPTPRQPLSHISSYSNGIQAAIWNEPLLRVRWDGRKRFLIARLLEGISQPNENSLMSIQIGLVRYWRELAVGIQKTLMVNTARTSCSRIGNIERQMKDIALGKVRTINLALYEDGRKHLRELKVQEEEEQARKLIGHVYRRFATSNKCSWYNKE